LGRQDQVVFDFPKWLSGPEKLTQNGALRCMFSLGRSFQRFCPLPG
jgi:hypothetical protein